MSARLNEFGQSIGPDLSDWTARPRPPRSPMEGRTCQVMPLVAEAHTAGLFATYSAAPDTRGWTYLGDEMPASEALYRARLEAMETSQDPLFHVVLDRTSGEALGIASYL
ncbi:MAG: GNAT family N-acetyltransferase, partial [Actinomycetospora chiangmaiensis]|nr:GNAT family N-acetyltransferase [Actinomycetospora chiangmaiensis]